MRAKRRSLARRFADGLKAFRMVFGGGSPWNTWDSSWGRLPSSELDYEALAGNLLDNGIVANCAGWIGDNVVEPEFRVSRKAAKPQRGGAGEGQWEVVADHPLAELLQYPNPGYDGDALWAATAISYKVWGNSYLLKVRGDGGKGAVREVWWVAPWQMRPRRAETGGNGWIDWYDYRAQGETVRLPVRDVVHFRMGIDPEDPRQGMSPLRAVLREVVTDNEASTMWAAVLRNRGVWSVVISPADGETEIPGAEAAKIQRRLSSGQGGENSGKPLVLSYPVKVDHASESLQHLLPEGLRHVPESRIAGAFRLPPLVVGLSVGDLTKTYANYGQARRAAYEDCLMPLGRRLARAATRQLLYWRDEAGRYHPEVAEAADLSPDGKPLARCGWDYTEVAALRENLTELYDRLTLAVEAGWVTPNEARAKADYPALAGADQLSPSLRPPRVKLPPAG